MSFETDVVGCLPRLRRYAHRLTRDADDLVQDTVLRALTKRGQFVTGTDLRSWLFTIMHNSYLDGVRKSARRNETIIYDVDVPYHANFDGPLLIGELVEGLKRLPVHQRRAVVMVASGMNYEEVARAEIEPVGTIRSRVSRGRDALRHALGEKSQIAPDEMALLSA